MKDAPYMLEWMHDASVVHDMATDFSGKTIADCEAFIKSSLENESRNVHRAVVDENDIYMGTVSLKHIDRGLCYAEFAITVRKCAMGVGYSQYAMQEVIRIAKEDMSLSKVYWCVNISNVRAVKFYNKMGYKETNDIPNALLKQYSKSKMQLIWFEC